MSDVIVESSDGILEVRLNRPAKKNALTKAMYSAATEALGRGAADPSIRSVVFTAAGDTFSAGNDMLDFVTGIGEGASTPVLRFIEALIGFPKPMVAAVHGAAIGIGATMLLHCDLVYASDTAHLSLPFVGLGLVPEAGSSLLLPQRVGRAVAAEMILLGAPVDARRAVELGLFNAIVPASALVAHAKASAITLAKKPPAALRAARTLLRGSSDELLARVREESAQFAACLTSPEAREAFQSFLERRPPDFAKLAGATA